MSISEITIVGLLSLSLLANLCYVVFNRQMGKYTLRWDLFRWISAYQLFSKTPRAFRLLCRYKTGSGISEWEEIPLTPDRRWYQPVIFPEALVTMALYSNVDDVVSFAEHGHDPREIAVMFNYRMIVRYLARRVAGKGPAALQMRIEETGGHMSPNDAREKFLSEFESV